MRRLSLIAVALLAACSQGDEDNQVQANEPSSVAAPAPPPPPSPPVSPAPLDTNKVAENLANADEAAPETPPEQRSPRAAAAVLTRYFALLEAKRYADAYQLWSDGGRASGMNPSAFAASFARFRIYRGEVGAPGKMEGAAGSSYIDIPVNVRGRFNTGRPFRQSGTFTLRRANDIPGSTPEQRQWRLYRSNLDAASLPAPASYRFVGRWATDAGNCRTQAWRFTATSLNTPAGSVCSFTKVTEVPGGYDIAARCTAEGPPTRDTLRLRFAESARALLFESDVIADAGLVRCR